MSTAAVGIIIALFTLGMFGGIVGLIYLVVQWGRRRTRERNQIWARVAHELGLHFMAGSYGHGSISGQRYGQNLSVAVVVEGSGDSRQTYTQVMASYPFPLDLGLSVRKAGFINKLFHPAPDIRLGDALFDERFLVSGDEPHRVRAVMSHDLQRHMHHHFHQADFIVHDRGVRIRTTGISGSEHWLKWAIEAVSRAAREIDQRRFGCPPATRLMPHRATWMAYASAHGLRGQDTPLCMWGKVEGAEVSVYAVRVNANSYALEVCLRFPASLVLGLSLKPLNWADKVALFFGGSDHRFGEPMFDEAFRVQTTRPDEVAEVLDAPTRAALLSLRSELGPPVLNDVSLTVRTNTVPHEPTAVPRMVQRMLAVAEAIGRRRDPRRGAYR